MQEIRRNQFGNMLDLGRIYSENRQNTCRKYVGIFRKHAEHMRKTLVVAVRPSLAAVWQCRNYAGTMLEYAENMQSTCRKYAGIC